MKQSVRVGQVVFGTIGVLGALVCMGTMVLAAIGFVGAGAGAVMGGMSRGSAVQVNGSQATSSFLNTLLQAGPQLLIFFVIVFALSFALRSWLATSTALVVGGVMYWGMYGQSDLAVMYLTMGLSLLGWLAIFMYVRGFSGNRNRNTLPKSQSKRL